MKANNRRKVFGDAVDLLMDDIEEKTAAGGLRMLPIKKIRPFHDHPFHLYEGDRLEDMVASVREHGILNPVIVQEIDGGYEMLSGHNRMNAAKLVGLKEIPAIVKTDLSEEEAYVYVIETNLMQRSFSDLLISEKAAVLKARYEKESCQGRRNDIIEEIARMEGKELPATCGHGDQRLNTRDMIGKEYELSGSSVGRLLKLNDLIKPFKGISSWDFLEREALLNQKETSIYVAPSFDLNGNRIRHTKKGIMHRIAITAFPEGQHSWILISCLESEYSMYEKFFDQLKAASVDKIKFYFNMILPLISENVVLSPELWNRWDDDIKMAYTVYANSNGSDAMRMEMAIGVALKNAYRSKKVSA